MEIMNRDLLWFFKDFLTWKECINLSLTCKDYYITLKTFNSKEKKIELAHLEFKKIDNIFIKIANINNIDEYIAQIVYLYQRFIFNSDIYLRIPCITVNALAKLSQLASDYPRHLELRKILNQLVSVYSYSNGILLYVNNINKKSVSSCFYNPTCYQCLIHGDSCKKKWKAFIDHEYPLLYLTP